MAVCYSLGEFGMPLPRFESLNRQYIPRMAMYFYDFKPYGKPVFRLYGDIALEAMIWKHAEEIDIGDHWMGEDA